MRLPIDDLAIALDCPQCGKQFDKPFGWLEKNNAFPCPSCGGDIRFTRDKLGKIREQLERLIKDASKTHRIKIDL